MALNINDPEIDRLAQELADVTGETVDQAVAKALRQQLLRERETKRIVQAVVRISEHFTSLPVLDPRTPDEIIGYDENGLPT